MERIPNELRELRQWHCWQLVNGSKLPVQVNGAAAKSNDPETWTDYETASAAAENFSGLAFELGDGGWCGIDLDDCIGPDGVKAWAWPIINKLDGVAYGEISPSGTGIKFVTRGSKTVRRCIKKMGGKREQMEIYDKRRFWCITADVYANMTKIRDGQQAIDWLCSEYLTDKPETEPQQPEPSPPLVMQFGVTAPIHQRAKAYIDKIPPASKGETNTTCFKMAGSLSAIDHHGERLTPAEITEYVAAYNAQCQEPMPPERLAKAIQSGMTNGTKPAAKLADVSFDMPQPEPRDFEYLTRTKAATPDTDGMIPVELFTKAPGILSELYHHLCASCFYELPEPFFAGCLSLMAVITGRKICGRNDLRTNLYCLSIAPTGSGKEHARKTIDLLLREAGGSSLIGCEDIGSAPGIWSMLQTQPACLMQLDEFGRMLATMTTGQQSHKTEIPTDLLKIYTSSARVEISGRAYANRENTPKINFPHLVINGTTTSAALWDSIQTQQVHDGLLGRCQIFEKRRYAELSKNAAVLDGSTVPLPPELVDRVRFWVEYQPPSNKPLAAMYPRPTELDYEPAAWDRWTSHSANISKRLNSEDSIAAAIWTRSAEKAHKLAIIAAAACKSFTVTAEHMNWAIALQNALTRKMTRRIEDNVADSRCEKQKKWILQKLTDGPISKAQLTRRTQKIGARERNELLTDLIEAKQVQYSKVESKTGGKPTEYFNRI